MGAFVFLGFHFEVLHIPGARPIDLSPFGIPLTILWLLAVVNGFNFMDGIDGLAGSLSVIILIGMGMAAHSINEPDFMGVLLLSILGAVFSFLFFNWSPAKVYLGDAGSNALGTFIAVSLVAMGSSRPALISLLEPQIHIIQEPFRFQLLVVTLLVGYPLLEVGLSTLRRGAKRFFFGRSIEWSEQEHIHHHFLKMGLRTRTICSLAILFQIVLSAAGISAIVRQNALAIWLLAPLFMFFAYLGPRTGFLNFLNFKHLKTKPHYMIAHHFIAMQMVKLQLARSREEILALVSQTCQEFGVKSCRLIIKADQRGLGGLDYLREWGKDLPLEYLDFIRDTAPEAGSVKGFPDHYKLAGGRGGADWVFGPQVREESLDVVYHVLIEEELDVEYHVLVSDFMREALEAASRLGVDQTTLELPDVIHLPHGKTSGDHLRLRPLSVLKYGIENKKGKGHV
jgi:hypothetical protein